jgi:hypothetical protein
LENILLITILLLAWYWLDSLSARDQAITKGHDLTQRTQLQLLDESVACVRLRLGRNVKGHVQIQRTYEFDVSANGGDRMHCHLVLLGRDLQSWYIPPYLQAVQ